ncbi:MAG: hypothetical protein M0R32_09240 [Candidatus Cloacimonetes bacterium]|jgi:Fe-S-cluster containining protein|nr:hypothetical protein [Candidatus Cloacimonadota bacterium]
MIDIIDAEKCRRCGGKCCRIYASVIDGGTRPLDVWFEEWCESWDEQFIESGAFDVLPPQFEPLDVHRSGNEHMWDELIAKGIDPEACKYLGVNGCLLPRKNRPKACREYMCKEELSKDLRESLL